ncbi:hypothetical protein KUH03_24465 [Sphingobacterium sp. E70]|uniref:hypothetical protein n=1 Tax=Sphingobacterium sp. E70 TaxID=2853439 RepID=UPI00211C6293|nr:hypothetical protein [Sphingobacterium sp. E70]ULT22534.1 hypothetical protein KUH03_24465 [Sphingobacterium sp. E70]
MNLADSFCETGSRGLRGQKRRVISEYALDLQWISRGKAAQGDGGTAADTQWKGRIAYGLDLRHSSAEPGNPAKSRSKASYTKKQ